MFRTLLPPTLLLLLLLLMLLTASPARAQDAEAPEGAREGGASFAGQFFIARRTGPGGEKSVELLGTTVIWSLLGLSVASIGLIAGSAVANRRPSILPAGLVAEVRRLFAAGEYRRGLELTAGDGSFFSAVLRAALDQAGHGFGAVARALEETAEELATRRLRRLEYLNVVGQVSPMIGLFGTVYGMILAFRAIVVAGGNADPVLLAGGISTALTTTFWGLVVAIPALAGYGIIRNKVDDLTAEATLVAGEMINQVRPKPSSRSGASGSAARRPAAAAPG